MNQKVQFQDETRRMHAELVRDPEYKKSRHTLLWVSVICCVVLALIGLMVMNGLLSIDMATIGITGCVMVYLYFIIRIVQMRNAAEARWVHAQHVKKETREKKKERKKGR